MRRLLAAAFLAVSVPAEADTLVDNVDGVTLDADGRVQRFTGILIDNDGRVAALLQRGDKRPQRLDYRLDGKGRVAMPGIVDSHVDLMAMSLALLGPAEPGARPRPEDRDDAFVKAQQLLLSRGITAVADMGTRIDAWQTYRRAGDLGRLSIRIVAYAGSVDEMVLIGGPRPTPWLYDDRLRLNGLHIALTAPPTPPIARRTLTAAQLEQAQRAAEAARERQQAIQLKNLLSRAAIDSFQGAIEVREAKAIPLLLDALAEIGETYKGASRWRIELTAPPDPADLPRLATAGAVLSLRGQASAAPPAGAALRIAYGSGTPGGNPVPFAAIAGAMPREAALAAYTAGGAWAGFAETRFGRLAKGQRADFILVDRDPLMAPAADARATAVLQTWVGGRMVYRAPGEEAQVRPVESR